MKKIFLLLTAFILFTQVSFADIAVGYTAEWLAHKSEIIAIATTQQVEEIKPENEGEIIKISFKLDEIIKGSLGYGKILSVYHHTTKKEFLSTSQGKAGQLLIFCTIARNIDREVDGKYISSKNFYNLTAYEVNKPVEGLFTPDFHLLTEYSDLLKRTREQVEYEKKLLKEKWDGVIIEKRVQTPWGSEAQQKLFCGSMCYLSVPDYQAKKKVPSPVFKQINAKKKVSDKTINKILSIYINKNMKFKKNVQEGMLTDKSIPYFAPVKKHVLRTLISDLKFDIKKDDKKICNLNIHNFEIYSDYKTKTVFAVSSPKLDKGGIEYYRKHSIQNRFLSLSVKYSSKKPKKTLFDIIRIMENAMPGSFSEAKELQAYYGQVTNPKHPGQKVINKPCWIIVVGGVKQPTIGGHSTSLRNKPEKPLICTEMLLIYDAINGELVCIERIANYKEKSHELGHP